MTHGNHAVPSLSTAPPPVRNAGSCFASAPPRGVSTMPVRRKATRTPASAAGAAAASQSRHTSARKPAPMGESSVSTSSPRSP
ncbi:hypothetical protein J0H58_22705, partial [bacterium]|nr:hypothetical protein [bacterium]